MSAPTDSGGGDSGDNKMETSSLVADYGCSDSDSADEAPTETKALSDMVIKNNIINACAHGPLPERVKEEGRQIIIDPCGGGVIEYSVSEYRVQDSDDTVSSDSSGEATSVKDADEVDSSEEDSLDRVSTPEPAPRVRGEMTLDDLPPIEELSISVPEEQVSLVGKIFHMLDKLVIVQALPGSPAVDLDTVLFLDKGERALGKVFDVFGPVTEPHYCVRFNSCDQIRERRIEPGMEVYIAPARTEHTNFVFLSQLMKMKGSDASWLHDIEPPPSQVEYSDDEQERRAKKERRDKKKPERSEQKSERPARTAHTSRPHATPRVRNPFAQTSRPPLRPPRPPRPWGAQDDHCPPFMLARPTFNPYGPPPFMGPMGFQRPQFRSPRPFGHMPWFAHGPPPPPPPPPPPNI